MVHLQGEKFENRRALNQMLTHHLCFCFQFWIPTLDTNQVRTVSSSLSAIKMILVLSNPMFIKIVITPSTHVQIMDQPLVEETTLELHTIASGQPATQTLAVHIFLHQDTPIQAVIPEHCWLAVIDFILLKLKFIIFLNVVGNCLVH